MRYFYFPFLQMALAVLAMTSITLPGCYRTTTPEELAPAKTDKASIKVRDVPPVGPHGGDLVDLGHPAIQAELLIGDTSVDVHFFGFSHAESVVIEKTTVAVAIVDTGLESTWPLQPSPAATDPPGESSMFTSSDEELVATVVDAPSAAEVVLTIDGTSYRGRPVFAVDGD